ncbi:hypothetical protein RB595_009539 [Gaeumannomyces hyphopodioides]
MSGDLDLCAICGEVPGSVYCEKCKIFLCSNCRNFGNNHGGENPNHPVVVPEEHLYHKRIEGILNPCRDPNRREEFGREDEALWFAVAPDENQKLAFEELPRFVDVIDEHRQANSLSADEPCFPSIVSFTGNSGSGKSTIIRLLMEHPWDKQNRLSKNGRMQGTATPVLGFSEGTVSTSSDVHLYGDPVPRDKQRPILFADCEGFHGGETPISLEERQRKASALRSSIQIGSPRERRATEYIANAIVGIKRSLRLTGSQQTRNAAISDLFPKLLYNISDVVVHIINATSAKSLEEDIARMLQWAESSQKTAVNRGTMPHLIIALNRSGEDCDWDPRDKTYNVFEEQRMAMAGNPVLAAEKKRLASLGYKVETLEQLLGFSYTTVQFMKLPDHSRFGQLLLRQLQVLYHMIEAASAMAHHQKAESRMQLSSAGQEMFFKMVFDHYSDSSGKAFDFMEKLISLHPLPTTMAENLFKFLRSVSRTVGAPEDLVRCATPVVAWAIALDVYSHENYPRGRLAEIVSGGRDGGTKTYQHRMESALDKFIDTCCPCDFYDADGNRCVNTFQGHGDIHQDKTGRCIGTGKWSAAAQDLRESFLGHMSQHWAEIDSKVHQTDLRSIRSYLWGLQKSAYTGLFKFVRSLEIDSSITCVWCMAKNSREVLPCGHRICDSCIRDLGRVWPGDARVTELTRCLLHRDPVEFPTPLRVLRLPGHVGHRVLSLDGGGVRGVIELAILDEIGSRLGSSELPVQRFFDLIGGTSTGGLIGLALGIGDQQPQDQIVTFKSLCGSAFQTVGSNALSQAIKSWWTACKYNTSALGSQLRHALGDRAQLNLLGARARNSDSHLIDQTKVFVTTYADRNRGSRGVLTSYVAPPVEADYLVEHSSTNPLGRFSVWEAAMATAAAPTYFKEFEKEPGWIFRDGALFANNPARIALTEHNRLWQNGSSGGSRDPDVLVSLGTGSTLASDGEGQASGMPMVRVYRMLKQHFDHSLDTEASWRKDFAVLEVRKPDRYVRLNPIFEAGTPKLDDVEALQNGTLEAVARDYLRTQEVTEKVRRIADRLISTSFYFEPTPSRVSGSRDHLNMQGFIRCRFIETSETFKAFGRLCGALKTPEFQLYYGGRRHVHWPLNERACGEMAENGVLNFMIEFTLPIGEAKFDLALHAEGMLLPKSSLSGSPMEVSKLCGLNWERNI